MEAFTTLSAVAAPMLRANIDTDIIIRIEKVILPHAEQGRWAFAAWRYRPDGSENPDFILNQPAYRKAQILLAGANVGCGSSREAAVWAMQAMGLRCVIACSFGEIFYNNCFQKGMLPVVLPEPAIVDLANACAAEPGQPITVDLATCKVYGVGGQEYSFDIDPMRREGLLNGLDQISLSLGHAPAVAAFQAKDRVRRSWVYLLAARVASRPVRHQ